VTAARKNAKNRCSVSMQTTDDTNKRRQA